LRPSQCACAQNRIHNIGRRGERCSGWDDGNLTIKNGCACNMCCSLRCRNTIGAVRAACNCTQLLEAGSDSCLIGISNRYHFGVASFHRVVLVLRNCHSSQDADDRYYDHQFDQGEAFLYCIHRYYSGVSIRCYLNRT